MSIYERAIELAAKQRLLQKQLGEIEDALAENEAEMLEDLCVWWNTLHPHHEDGPRKVEDLVVTYNWECGQDDDADYTTPDEEKSPIGYCVYDVRTDPGDLDECIFCGAPNERK